MTTTVGALPEMLPTLAFWSPITNDPCASGVIESTFTVVDPWLEACPPSPLYVAAIVSERTGLAGVGAGV